MRNDPIAPSPVSTAMAAPKSIGLVVNTEREGATLFVKEFSSWLETQGLRVCATRSVVEEGRETDEAYHCLVGESDLVVVMGGDGSLLGAIRRAAPAGKPVLGIHWGGMGFLNECQPDQAQDAILRMLRGDYWIEERLMLLSELWRDGTSCGRFPAVNDVAVTRDTLSRILRLDVLVGDEVAATYQGDGVIIASPTGSTAHSLSAGGPVLDPRVQVLSVTPICPHALNGRAMVVPGQERLRIRHSSPRANVIITLDGQVGMPMRETDVLEVTAAPWPARFIRFGNTQFYRTLRDKFHWRV